MSVADATINLRVGDPKVLPAVPPGGRAPFSVFAHTGPCRGAAGQDIDSPIFTLRPVMPGTDRTVRRPPRARYLSIDHANASMS